MSMAGVGCYIAARKSKQRECKGYRDSGRSKTGDSDESMPDDKDLHKNALIVTSVASMIDQFILSSIRLLIDMGYDVDVTTNFVDGSTCSDEKIQELISALDEMGVDCYHIGFDRKVMDAIADIKSFQQLDEVVCGKAEPINVVRHHRIETKGGNRYIFIHSHSPIGGVVGRITARRYHIRSIYTAHGFHFYDGAPKKNWLIFYPIEWSLSWLTDVLITINKEDYKRASERLHAKKTVYIPGVGIDVEKFSDVKVHRVENRTELGLKDSDIMLLSIGELNENKNHKVVVEALGMMGERDRSRLHYFIAGKDAGERDALMQLAEKKSVNLHLLGFRTDIPELLKTADVFILPSIREGLNVGLMEAMASGLPVIASDIRGNRDLIISDGYLVPNVTEPWNWKKAISEFLDSETGCYKTKRTNNKILELISVDGISDSLRRVYEDLMEDYLTDGLEFVR